VRNEAMSRMRAAARRTERERRVLRLEPPLDHEADVVDHVEAGRVRAALERLPSEQREVIEQAFFANRTQRQIAEKLGIPLGTVKGRVALAMRKLQAELARERSA
jgi:RNA polymerase sigma-70 factor (ECF subfamily)